MTLALLLAATMITVSQPVLVLISGTVIPALTAAVTKDLTGWLQVVLLAVLSAVAGVIAQATTGAFPLWPTVWTIAVTAAVAVAAHYGYSISGALGAISRATAGFGVGVDHGLRTMPAPGATGTRWVTDPDPVKPKP